MIESKETLTGNIISKQTISGSVNVSTEKVLPTLEDITIIPQKVQQVFTHENSYGYDKVTVNPISDEYIIPSGTKDIITNGYYQVLDYEGVNVDVHTMPTLQDKEVIPTKDTQTITSDAEYDGLNEVKVNPIPDNYVEPSGTLTITENGTYDVKQYEEAVVNVAGGGSESLYTPEGYMKSGLVAWWEGSDELDENYRWLSRVGDDYISQYKPTLNADGSNSFGNIKTDNAYVNDTTYGLVTSKDYWGEDYTIEVVGKVNSQINSNNSSGGTLLAFDKQVSPMIQIWGTDNIFGCLNQVTPATEMPYLFTDCLGKRYKYTISLREVPAVRNQSGQVQISYALNDIGWYTRITSGQSAGTCRPNLTILCYYRDSYLSNAEINSIRIYSRRLSVEELKHNYEIDKVRFNLDAYEK